MKMDEELLDILVCPRCKGAIRLAGDETGLICDACRLFYEIRDGIPIMLVDRAEPLGD